MAVSAAVSLVLALVAATAVPARAASGAFHVHMRFTGVGGCLKQLVGPGPTPGSERLYASHIYDGAVLEIVAIDPDTGAADVFPSPVPGEIGAWAMALGRDGQVYVGTLPTAHILRLDWKRHRLVDMGRPSPSEQYIWHLALGSDGKLYGCTYPDAKLVRFDPATGKGEDLGRMDPTELYARTVAADARGFVYVGIGPSHSSVVAYDIATAEHRNILPKSVQGADWGSVHLGADGFVYASAGGQNYRLEGWTATPVHADKVSPEAPLTLRDGCAVSYGNGKITVGGVTHEVAYKGRSQAILRIGAGPDGQIYGSTAMPIHFFRADPASDQWSELGVVGGGEFYSLLAWKDELLCAAYSGNAPIMIYHPGRPFAPSTEATGNPWLIHFTGENGSWRPMAMVAGANGKVYIGAVSGYGLLGGPLCDLDPGTGKVDAWPNLVQDESVVALAVLPDGRIVGGTTVGGGGGSHPTQTEAKLFVWDPATRKKVFETVPVSGCGSVDALAVVQDGRVFGFADDTMFVFDPQKMAITHHVKDGLGDVVYNAVGAGPGGKLYGLTSRGIFVVDTHGVKARMIARYRQGITAGFAIIGHRIYFGAGPDLVSYTLPR